MNDTPRFVLSQADLDRISDIQQTLLDLPRQRTQAAVRAALTASRELIGSDGAFALYFFDGTPILIADGLGDQIEQYVFGCWRGFDEEGYFLFDDEELEAVNRLRRSFGSGVYHEARLGDRAFVENTRFYREGFAPAGMGWATGLTARLPVGEAVFAFNVAPPGREHVEVDARTEALLRLLLPTFEAGFAALYDQSTDAAHIMPTLEALPFPAAIVSTDGRVAFVNDRARRDPEALGVASLGDGTVPARRGVYGMPGPVLEGTRSSRIFIAVMDDRAVNIESAAASYKLTPRQTEVARMMLQGLTDKQIAHGLDISLHTARRHAETVLDRLGVSSRASVLLALLEASQIRVA